MKVKGEREEKKIERKDFKTTHTQLKLERKIVSQKAK